MSRPDIMFYHAKKPAAAAVSDTTIKIEYCAPTVGLEDQVLTFGKAKDASMFEL